jgi:hypothetical protein
VQPICFQRVATVRHEGSFDGDSFAPGTSVISSRRVRFNDLEFLAIVRALERMMCLAVGDADVKEGLI